MGQAVVVPTGLDSLPLLISAPTMRIPMDVPETVNARQMHHAYYTCYLGQLWRPSSLGQVQDHHFRLVG